MDADELSSALRRRKVRVLHPGRESVHEAPEGTKGSLGQLPRWRTGLNPMVDGVLMGFYSDLIWFNGIL